MNGGISVEESDGTTPLRGKAPPVERSRTNGINMDRLVRILFQRRRRQEGKVFVACKAYFPIACSCTATAAIFEGRNVSICIVTILLQSIINTIALRSPSSRSRPCQYQHWVLGRASVLQVHLIQLVPPTPQESVYPQVQPRHEFVHHHSLSRLFPHPELA